MQRWVSAAWACAWISLFASTGSAASEDFVVFDVVPLPAGEADEGVPPAGEVLDTARSLLAAGKADDAYEFLSRHEPRFAGNPNFDYLLGLAALDSRRPRDASFALERVVSTEPAFLGARVDLARAQFENGDFALAREQFQFLLTQEPPDETRALIQRYVDSIATRSLRFRSRWSALAQFGAGYDSNANGSTSEQTFLGFTLSPHNVETRSSFGELTLRGGHVLSIAPTFGVISNLDLMHRSNTDASFIDQSVVSLGSTAVWARGAYRFTGGVDGYSGWLDGEDHERGINLNAGASRSFGDYEGAVSARAGTLEYQEDSLRILDMKRYLAGVSLARVNLGDRAARVGAALLLGKDEPRQAGSPYGNDRFGLRLFGSLLLRPDATVYAELSDISTDFDGSFFGSTRDDDQLGVTVAFDLQNFPAPKWSISPRLRYVKNDSNIALYEYHRVEAVVFIRRGF